MLSRAGGTALRAATGPRFRAQARAHRGYWLIAARGSDLIATVVSRELARRGVQLAGPVLEGKTGTVVSVSYGGGHRSMLTDRGVGPLLAPAHIDAGWLDGCAWLHLPGL